jgi:hypothetical protein
MIPSDNWFNVAKQNMRIVELSYRKKTGVFPLIISIQLIRFWTLLILKIKYILKKFLEPSCGMECYSPLRKII